MKTIKSFFYADPMATYGLSSIFLSFLIFAYTSTGIRIGQDDHLGIFIINYSVTSIYTISVLIKAFSLYRWKISKSKIDYTVIMMVLWFISAFSLNLSMNVFEQSVPWLSVFIILSALSLILALYRNKFPKLFQKIIFFFLGIGLVLFLYYTLYLVPFYLLSLPFAVALGISLHSYVPLVLLILVLVIFSRASKEQSKIRYFFFAGIVIPLLICIGFVFYWKSINQQINKIVNQNTLSEGKLPSWMVIAQFLPQNLLTNRILKQDLIYKTVTLDHWWWLANFSRRFDEPLQHDPMIVIAGLFTEKTNLDENDRIKILESMYDSRHQAQERLWSGDHLRTTNIITNIRLFPEYRIAYTEKTLSISNVDQRRWSRPQEAIYSFHLPEGSVVSSLSLWVNGREEKARLTTKSKADSAYHQVVGVEQRDPSVVHWQEGNTVSVRVFPCTPAENRKFKIGISSPLKKQGNLLKYENIYFDGPEAKQAIETVQLTYSNKPEELNLNSDYEEVRPGVYQLTRDYRPDWELSFKSTKLSTSVFAFDGSTYHVKNYTPVYENFNAGTIYLDLNQSWTKTEFNEIWDRIKSKKVMVFDGQMLVLDQQNKDGLFKKMNKLNFSLFPVYKIDHPEDALMISKSTQTSPNLNDLNKSAFGDRLNTYLQHSSKIRLYTIGTQLSPYLKALKEFRVFHTDSGTAQKLTGLLEKKIFIKPQENESNVVIDGSGMTIEAVKDTLSGNAPDHLLRLFAYNDILKKIGCNYFNTDYVQSDLIAEAQKANIVTPVSSLIVLETKEDYKRFDITQSKDSLKNASMNSSGAVPEPHEWVLILLAAGTAIYLISRPKYIKEAA